MEDPGSNAVLPSLVTANAASSIRCRQLAVERVQVAVLSTAMERLTSLPRFVHRSSRHHPPIRTRSSTGITTLSWIPRCHLRPTPGAAYSHRKNRFDPFSDSPTTMTRNKRRHGGITKNRYKRIVGHNPYLRRGPNSLTGTADRLAANPNISESARDNTCCLDNFRRYFWKRVPKGGDFIQR